MNLLIMFNQIIECEASLYASTRVICIGQPTLTMKILRQLPINVVTMTIYATIYLQSHLVTFAIC